MEMTWLFDLQNASALDVLSGRFDDESKILISFMTGAGKAP